MPGLQLRFAAGRYHATPWGHHVNEGLVEWPPCPWRVLRALLASGFGTRHWTAIPAVAASLIGKLAGTLPRYTLPEAYAAHSRHYMPIGALDKGREKTTLVFDTWLDVGKDAALEIDWPCELSREEFAELAALAGGLGYLGRSESWVEARPIERAEPRNRVEAIPQQDGEYAGPDWEQITLIAAAPPQEYDAWRQRRVDSLLAEFPLPEGRRPAVGLIRRRERVVAPYPESLIECLTRDTSWWKSHGWSQPPGSRRVLYRRSRGAIQIGAVVAPRVWQAEPVRAMLIAITTPSGNRAALPSVARTLPQAELLHDAIVSALGKGDQADCPEITGRDRDGQPLRGSHGHAHILPLDLDGDRRLDHFLIYAPMKLSGTAQGAIRGVRRTWSKDGAGDLQLAAAGSGELATLRTLPEPLRGRVEAVLGPPAGSHTWVSLTPFVPPRYLKERGVNGLAGQINAELRTRGLPIALEVTALRDTPAELALRHFERRRKRGGAPPPIDIGMALRLRFAEPVCGPLALGYGSHFGLGLFAAAGEHPA